MLAKGRSSLRHSSSVLSALQSPGEPQLCLATAQPADLLGGLSGELRFRLLLLIPCVNGILS